MTHRRASKLAMLVAASTLALTACSSGSDEPVDTGDQQSTSPEPTATESETAAGGKAVTPPGTQLSFGDSATVAYEDGDKETLLSLRVESAVQGSLEDFEGFSLDDPYKRRGNYYYVRVMVKNAGKNTTGDVPVPLWGISGDNTLLQAVQFKSSFAKCPTEPLPAKFKPKDTFKTCLVYLSPNKGKLQGVSYRPTEQFEPIEWRGPVKMLKTEKDEKQPKGEKQQ